MAKRGRPKTIIDIEEAEKLGMLQCTYKECSAWLGIAESTLKTHSEFSTAYKKGLEKGKLSLRRSQFKLAEKNPTMAIWLGKQYLGQTDLVNANDESDWNNKLKEMADLARSANNAE